MLRMILSVVAGLIMLFAVGGLFLPREVHVERSVTIYAAPEQVFPYLNDFHAFNEWSPWAAKVPDAVYTFSGPQAGVGAAMSWSGNDAVGSGSQEITASEPYTRLEVALDFGSDGTALAFFDLLPVDEGTQVTWGFDTDMGFNPVGRFLGLMMDGWVGPDYAEGLLNLRNLVEDQTSVMRMPDGTPMDPNTMNAMPDQSAKPDTTRPTGKPGN